VSVLPAVVDAFHARFKGVPTAVARAPGRVNLIGDHTDYNGLPVLPMALQREVVIAFRPRDDSVVRVFSVLESHAPVTCSLGVDVIPGPRGDWGNYVRAAVQEVSRILAAREGSGSVGWDGVVAGDIPIASGLSSSSALVVASGLATLHANGVSPDRRELMAHLALAERYVGTEGGGMDQAISLGGVENHAVKIDFEPLCLTPVLIPRDWRFVVAFSGARAEKSGAAQASYNERVKSCRTALSRAHDWATEAGLEPAKTASFSALLRSDPSHVWIARLGGLLTRTETRRLRHTLSEAERVATAVSAMRVGDGAAFGRLMNESHQSLRDDYDVSTAELERLVGLAREGGAWGARLTGAGFGGCIVALAKRTAVDGVLDRLRTFRTREGVPLDEAHLFRAKPSAGASVRHYLGPPAEGPRFSDPADTDKRTSTSTVGIRCY
jgi:galactokinase